MLPSSAISTYETKKNEKETMIEGNSRQAGRGKKKFKHEEKKEGRKVGRKEGRKVGRKEGTTKKTKNDT